MRLLFGGLDISVTGGGGGSGGGSGGGGGETILDRAIAAPSPRAMVNEAPPSRGFHKLLSGLSFGQHLVPDQRLNSHSSSSSFPPPLQPSFPCFSEALVVNNTPCPAATCWAHPQQMQGSLPAECYNSSGSHGPRDLARHPLQHVGYNGGSLVLDTAKGELVNASKMTPKEILEAKALAASKSHSEAERRRRERINSHLGTLRALLPSTTKTDKASLLAEVIDQVKVLKHQVSKIYERGPMPTDLDELCVEESTCAEAGNVLIKASLCCDDRPDLMNDLRDAMDSLKLRALKVEISTLGGRIRSIFLMTLKNDSGEHCDRAGLLVKRVREAFRLAMEGSGNADFSPCTSNKRQKTVPSETPGYFTP